MTATELLFCIEHNSTVHIKMHNFDTINIYDCRHDRARLDDMNKLVLPFLS
jgi:hypothetical protein